MSYETDTATRYRDHAEELRLIAEADRHETTKNMLLRIAADYEHMARSLEEIEATNLWVRRH